MAREAKSHVRKRRRGCISGCLTNILLLLGLAALLFVGACVLGFVKNDPETGAPSLSLDGVTGLSNLHLPDVSLPENLPDVTLPSWAYGVSKTGLTVKTLRAGDGEAVLVCADGYTMLLGGGSGMGVTLTGQLRLCGVSHLNAAVALSRSLSWAYWPWALRRVSSSCRRYCRRSKKADSSPLMAASRSCKWMQRSAK